MYVAPLKALVRERMRDWEERIERALGRRVVELTGDVHPDISALRDAAVIITSPEKWDCVSRAWRAREHVRRVRLIVFDEIHLLGIRAVTLVHITLSERALPLLDLM